MSESKKIGKPLDLTEAAQQKYEGGLQPLEQEGCDRWEAALADLLEGALLSEEEAALREHAATCEHCGVLLRDAGHGREWMRLLHDAPLPVPEALLGKILAKTAVQGAPLGAGSAAGEQDGLPIAGVLAMPQGTWTARGQREARVLMTAAMAFFSVALTLSLTGVHLAEVSAAMRSPASVGVSASRQFFDTKKQVVSFYDNLRLVREVEATVQDLRHTSDGNAKKSEPQKPLHPSAFRIGNTAAGSPMLAVCPLTAEERKSL